MTQALSAELAENLIEFCEMRGRVYALASRCYEKEIDAEFARELAACRDFDADDDGLKKAFADLRADVAEADEAALEQLAVVFDRVFFGMGPRTSQKAFPYESVYTSEGGLMMQDAYSEVLHVYRREGFEKAAGFTEPEDHLAVELAFMARMCERSVEALGAGDGGRAEELLRSQQAFLNEHLLNWIPRFAAESRAAAQGGFYMHLAMLTEAFLRADAEALDEVLK